MAFSGYLLKLNGTTFPLDYIMYETYLITPNQRLDLNSTRDTTGVLHRTVLSHTATKIEFNTPPMNNSDVGAMMNLIRNSWSNQKERRVSAQYYDMETDSYQSGTFYMPDIQFTIRNIDLDNNIVNYNSARIALIEY